MASDHESAREWLVQGDMVTIQSLFDHIAQEPDVNNVQRIAPDTVVLSMPPAVVARLRMVFGSRLVIEPNNDIALPSPPM